MSRNQLQFFVVDNEETACNQFTHLLFSHSVLSVSNPDAAYRHLSGSPTFDVALIDLSFPVRGAGNRKEELFGLGVVERVSEKVPGAIVIAYSGSDDLVAKLDEDLRRRGADLVCKRHELFHSAEQILALVEQARKNRREKLKVSRPLWPYRRETNSMDKALLEEVGEHVLREAAVAARPSSREDRFAALGGGRSGDWVVHMWSSEPGRPDGEWVLKISRNSDRLSDELAGAPLLGERGSVFATRSDPGLLSLSDGWFGVTSEFAADSITLRRYLRDADVSETVSILRILAERVGLRFQHSARADSLANKVDRTLGWRFVAQIESVVGELSPWLGTYAESPEAARLLRWLSNGASGEWKLIEDSTRVCFSHGDFHGENILIDRRSNTFYEIDFARSRIAPRLEDYCTLLVDLIVYDQFGRDWNTLGWEQVPLILSRLSHIDLHERSSDVWAELGSEKRIASSEWYKLMTVAASECGEEERVSALVLQLLRYSRFDAIPHVIRSILLRWATHLVQRLPVVE